MGMSEMMNGQPQPGTLTWDAIMQALGGAPSGGSMSALLQPGVPQPAPAPAAPQLDAEKQRQLAVATAAAPTGGHTSSSGVGSHGPSNLQPHGVSGGVAIDPLLYSRLAKILFGG